MKRHLFSFILISIILTYFTSCSDSKYPGYQLSDNGVNYKFHHKSGETLKAEVGNYVSLNLRYSLEDSVLFNSKDLNDILTFPYAEHNFEGDLYDAISLMSPGDSMSFVIVADSFYLKTGKLQELPEFITPGELMYYDIGLIKIENTKEYQRSMLEKQQKKKKQEISKLLKYIRSNEINTSPLESGLYYMEIEKGKGANPKEGDICKVRLEVSELDGRLLYSNMNPDLEPLEVVYGEDFDTKGFMQGLGLMKSGSKSQLIVPSSIGVGSLGMQGVDGYTTLIYTVSLEEIKISGK
ncbi:MAG: hypothetical protein C0598_12035 [Marinilabiliales bacterium]|nr:MAG: hypothetical protein C0598_12035 [Marinilabiliales bacterium]